MRPPPGLSLACVALLAACGAARADQAAEALIQKARKAATEAKTLQADLVYRFHVGEQKGGFDGAVRLMKPNYARLQMNGPDGKEGMVTLSDGENTFVIRPSEKQYQKLPAVPKGIIGYTSGAPGFRAPIVAFFEPEILTSGPEHRSLGTRKVDGKSYQVVQFTSKAPLPGPTRYFFGPSGLLEGVEMEVAAEGRTGTVSMWLKNVRVNAPMTAKQFAYTPPAGFTLYRRPSPDEKLLAVGTKAPEFRLPTPDGGELSLAGLRQGKKAVLVNFWFYH